MGTCYLKLFNNNYNRIQFENLCRIMFLDLILLTDCVLIIYCKCMPAQLGYQRYKCTINKFYQISAEACWHFMSGSVQCNKLFLHLYLFAVSGDYSATHWRSYLV